MNSPPVSIIKINSAESLGDFEEAKRYENINKLYGEFAKDAAVSPERYWKNQIISRNRLASNDRKFTNQLNCADYNIEERIDGTEAQVILASKNAAAQLQAIVYGLTRIDSTWVVEKIDYTKRKD